MAEQAAQIQGAEPPPPGQTDLSHPQNALCSISLIIAVLTLIFPAPFLLMRVYTPWKLSSPLRIDDWACAAAVLFGITYLASGIVFAEHGGGHHVWEVTVSQLQSILETTYWNSILYGPAALSIKTTLLLITIRAFRGNRLFTYFGYSLIAVMLGYYVPLTVLKIMTCRPIRGYWDYSEESSCYDNRSVFLSDAIGAMTTDLLVLLMAGRLVMLWGIRVKVYLIVGAGSLATAISLVRMVLVIRLQETKDPTLDFVRLSLFAYVNNSAIITFPKLSLSLLPSIAEKLDEYIQLRKGLLGDSRRSRPCMGFRPLRLLGVTRLRSQRLTTPENATRTASPKASGIQVEIQTTVTREYIPETSPRPPSPCLRTSTANAYTMCSSSPERAAFHATAVVYQTDEEAPPIPEKSAARLSMQRKSWGPTTTLSNDYELTNQVPEEGATTHYTPEPRNNCLLEGREWIPYFPPPLFSKAREIPPIQEVTTPASTDSSAQDSPRMLSWSPRWSRWPWSSTISPSPPATPVGDMPGQSSQIPPLYQRRCSDCDYRHYSV